MRGHNMINDVSYVSQQHRGTSRTPRATRSRGPKQRNKREPGSMADLIAIAPSTAGAYQGDAPSWKSPTG